MKEALSFMPERPVPFPSRSFTPMSQQDFSQPFNRLLNIVARLRSPQGCPWDARQTPESLKPHLLEECYEVLDAIDQGSPPAIRQELGDLLLQIVLVTRIFEEQNTFHMGDVAESIAEKLVRRHPHVFEGTKIESMEALNRQWDDIKIREQGLPPGQSSLLNNIPKALPALAKAQKITAKAGRVGFDWPDCEGVFHKIAEEFNEFRAVLDMSDKKGMEHEFGDIILSLVNLARFLEIDAENALQKAVTRFQKRFEYIENQLARQGKDIRNTSLEEMDSLWETAKAKEQNPPSGNKKE